MAINGVMATTESYRDAVETTDSGVTRFNETSTTYTEIYSNSTYSLASHQGATLHLDTLTLLLLLINGAIYIIGVGGNVMVLYVISRYTRMKTVTNVYIFNLSLTDFLFLLSLPMLMTSTLTRRWVFGSVMCRVYYLLTCVNMFTGTFTLTLMSADRFLAVWYPVSSLRYRTPRMAAALSAVAWFVSIVVMFPIILYVEQQAKAGPVTTATVYRCTVEWPAVHAAQAYIGYTATIGFAIPVAFICIFYALLLIRLRTTRRHIRSATNAAGHQRTARRSVTFLVTSVITVFVACWLPYWAFQVRASRK